MIIGKQLKLKRKHAVLYMSGVGALGAYLLSKAKGQMCVSELHSMLQRINDRRNPKALEAYQRRRDAIEAAQEALRLSGDSATRDAAAVASAAVSAASSRVPPPTPASTDHHHEGYFDSRTGQWIQPSRSDPTIQ
jgi:hypothetical protein